MLEGQVDADELSGWSRNRCLGCCRRAHFGDPVAAVVDVVLTSFGSYWFGPMEPSWGPSRSYLASP